MNLPKTSSHKIDGLFSILLFCIFALSASFVLLFGSQVYTHVVASGQENSQMRTTLTYIAEKVRQNDSADEIHLREMDGLSVLEFNYSHKDVSYSTYIYAWEDSLRELTQRSGDTFYKEAGQAIGEASDFQIQSISDGLFLCTISDLSGKEESVYVSSRCS